MLVLTKVGMVVTLHTTLEVETLDMASGEEILGTTQVVVIGSSHQFLILVLTSHLEDLDTQWVAQDTLQEGQDTTQVVDTQEDTALQVCVLVTSAVAWLIITAAWVVSSAIHTMNNSARGWTGQDVR